MRGEKKEEEGAGHPFMQGIRGRCALGEKRKTTKG